MIELRDIIAAILLSGKVNDFTRSSCRKKGEDNEWRNFSKEELTEIEMENAAINAYKMSDIMLKIRKKDI